MLRGKEGKRGKGKGRAMRPPLSDSVVSCDYQEVVPSALPQPPLEAGVQERTSPVPECTITNW
jgi:hypothetical protein